MTDLHNKLRDDLAALQRAAERDEPLPESTYIDANGDVQLKPGRVDINDVIVGSSDPTDAELASASALARMIVIRRREAIDLTSRLKAVLEDLDHLETQDLPQAMQAIDSGDFSLGDGTPVLLKTSLRSGNVTAPERLKWIEEHNGKSLIKATIILEMDREDIEVARAIHRRLREDPAANRFTKLEMKEFVHSQTMIGFMNDLIAQLQDPPLEELGVLRTTRAQVGARPVTVELKGLAQR